MTILVLAEHDGKTISAATRSTLGAAGQLGGDVHLLVCAADAGALCEAAAKLPGVAKVLQGEGAGLEHGLAEAAAPLIAGLADGYSHILAPATTFGKNILPRAAALKDCQQISDITKIIDGDTFERPVYAGNAIATVKSADNIKFITVRPTAFDAVAEEGGSAGIESVDVPAPTVQSRFVSQTLSESDRPELASARVVVSGGRALGSYENFDLIEKLADKLGGAVGASRAAVDAGYVPNDYQVGQTGKVVAPELYIAIGISGAIQHLAGMKDSKVIVAINKDEDAPIFQIADYGLVGDLFDIVPELTEKL